jgi:hypothetical protein
MPGSTRRRPSLIPFALARADELVEFYRLFDAVNEPVDGMSEKCPGSEIVC